MKNKLGNYIFYEFCLECNASCTCTPEEHEKYKGRGFNRALYICKKCINKMGEEKAHILLHQTAIKRMNKL